MADSCSTYFHSPSRIVRDGKQTCDYRRSRAILVACLLVLARCGPADGGSERGASPPGETSAAPPAAARIEPPGKSDALPLRVSNDVVIPRVIKRVAPTFPPQKRPYEIGLVIFEIVIDTKGNVRNPRIIKGSDNEFTRAAMAALEQWQFEPATLRGEPIAVTFNVSMNHVPIKPADDAAPRD